MADNLSVFKHGAASFPVTASTSNSYLKDGDPALYWALNYFESVLNTYMGARVAAEATAAGMTGITTSVLYKVPYDPVPYLAGTQFKFPLLAVYRRRTIFEDRTLEWRHSVSEWGVDYILPPMTAGQLERMQPALHDAGCILENRTEMVRDAAFQSNINVWDSTHAFVETIEFKSGEFVAAWDDASGLPFPLFRAVLQVKERVNPVAGAFETLDRIDANHDLDEDTDLTDALVQYTDTDP